METKWIVYRHTSPSGGVYVGITKNSTNKRWGLKGQNYKDNKYFSAAIKKYGWDNIKHEVLFKNLNEESAILIEEDLIYYYKHVYSKHCYNIADKQDSWNHANERAIYQLNDNFEVITGYTSIAEAAKELNCCNATIGEALIDHCKRVGFYWIYKEDLTNIKNIKFKKGVYKKAIYQINKCGDVIKIWKSGREITKTLNLCKKGYIYDIIKYQRKTKYGYFCYSEDYPSLKNKLRLNSYKIQNGEVVKYFATVKELCKYLNISSYKWRMKLYPSEINGWKIL